MVVLEHTAGAGLSAFEEVLETRRTIAPWRRIDVPSGAALPDDLDRLAGLVVMGGTMSAVAPDEHPWMPSELALLRDAVSAEVPVLGVCLGAQLLAQALGGVVERRARPRAAYVALRHVPDSDTEPVTAGWPDGAAVLFVHEDHVTTLPPDAVPLLRDDEGLPAWRIGSAVALQCHPEVTAQQLARWVDRGALDDLLGRAGVDGAALSEEASRRERVAVPLGRALVGRFLDGPVRERATQLAGA